MKMNELLETTATQSPEPRDTKEASVPYFDLCDVEVETVKRAALQGRHQFDPDKRRYSAGELAVLGLVREGYNRDEARRAGVTPSIVSSLDLKASVQGESLPLETPFGSGIRKFQLPIDMFPMRTAITTFPPNTEVRRHVHPPHSADDPGGGLRIVVSGSILFEGREYGPKEWFFVPNGTPYAFTTDRLVETIVFYTYRFFGAEQGNRFSHPFEV